MDSTALVALARTFMTDELRTFSIAFPGSTQDEGPSARRTAALFRTVHHELALDGVNARASLDEFLSAADQPSIDGFNTFVVSRLARSHGIKVVLSGLGGDELFGGYPSFRGVPRLLRRARLARRSGPIGPAIVRLAGNLADPRVRRLNDLMNGPIDLEAAYDVFRGIYSDDEARQLAAHHVGGIVEPEAAPSETPPADATAEDTISRLEITRYMRNQLLRDTDVMSMASGVELRVPFLDSGLFDALSRIPSRRRLAPGKTLLLRAVPEIPAWVANQPKRGFLFPFEQWMAGSWAEAFAAIDHASPVRAGTWYRKWAILAFEEWRDRLTRPLPGGTALRAGAANG
jgi:asparagine synthase (glutamine-hydrolysing)